MGDALAPSAANFSAMPLPKPDAPPVMIAVLPDNLMMPSIGCPTTGDVKHSACREAAFIAREPSDQCCNLICLSKAPHWDLGEHEVDVILGHLIEDGGFNGGWRHTSDFVSPITAAFDAE